MTPAPDLPLAATDDTPLSLPEFLHILTARRQLRPLAVAAVAAKVVRATAAEVGLAVDDAELQRAADLFRRRHGLAAAEAARRWLDESGLTADDFAAGLEHDLLAVKLRNHPDDAALAAHLAAHADRFTRLRLRRLVTADEGLARELQAQAAEGRDFADLAREHAADPAARAAGGLLGDVTRGDLPPAVADLVFAAPEGAVVGPVATDAGFALFRVERRQPARLDDATRERIRDELFADWLRGRLRTFRVNRGAVA